ncbi:glycosyltransferase [Methylobacterium sp. C1]|uniref:glycosyltransferase family 4 protein n=1 Tax=Methylobacterium sp. C1 TaxID=1479019 RepID=UPI0009F6704F|nr:glycosyltransferase [Methylobacterium sp. C1]
MKQITMEKGLTSRTKILVDGPMAGTYSLALVNRKFAVALGNLGFDVFVTQREGPDPTTDQFFLQEPGLKEKYIPYCEISLHEFDVHTKNDWPMAEAPRCAPILTAHCYAWEESLFPTAVIAQLNKFDAIFCTSRYTIEALSSSGYTGTMYYMGNGVDHIENMALVSNPNDRAKRGEVINFVHVSSGLPRKGMKAGLRAFLDEFHDHDDVQLIIKTHYNTHNELYELFSSLDAASKKKIVFDDSYLSSAEIQKLIMDADCCFLPSKGEGFSLPAAEAMLLGTLVCTTDAGGNREFCTPDTCVLIPTKFVRSSSAISFGKAAWLEATHEDLRSGLRRAYELCKARDETLQQQAYTQVKSYTWQRTADYYFKGLQQLTSIKETRRDLIKDKRIALVSTFNQQCGIATFSGNLVKYLSDNYSLDVAVYSEIVSKDKIIRNDGVEVKRSWSRSRQGVNNLLQQIYKSEAGSFFIIQHHPGIIGWEDLAYLCNEILSFASGLIVELHSTDGGVAQIKRFLTIVSGRAALIVHNNLDYVKLIEICPESNFLYLFPHPAHQVKQEAIASNRSYKIFTFGLCSRHKNFEHLFYAVYELKHRGLPVSLNVLTSVDPKNAASIDYSHFLYQLRDALGLRKEIELNFNFLPIEEVFAIARSSHVAVFCYADVTEGASGAIRVPLSCGVPTITSPSSIFADLSGICTQIDTSDSILTANAIQELVSNPAKTARLVELQNDYISFSSWTQHVMRLTKLFSMQINSSGMTRG